METRIIPNETRRIPGGPPALVLAASLADRHPVDAANVLEGSQPGEVAAMMEAMPIATVRRVIEAMSIDAAAELVRLASPARTLEVFEGLSAKRATSILRGLPQVDREAVFAAWPEDKVTRYRKWAGYPADTAGAMMDPEVTTIRKGMTVDEAVRKLRKAKKKTVSYLYVTEPGGKLTGVLTIRELLLAEPDTLIDALPTSDLLTIPADMASADVAHAMQDHKLLALPVVDEDGNLIGVVRHNEALNALQAEAFGDLQKMVGAGGDERALSPVSVVVRKRLPWLVINLGTAFLAAAVVGVFESTISAVTALAVLLPVVAGQGGNTGAQSMAVVMRGIALRELGGGNTRRLLLKEMIGALINGIAIALICGIAVLIWDGRLALGGVIFIAMIVNMTAAGLSGAAVPLILRRLGFDPAQASSIVLTTITDIVGFAAFLGCAVMFMQWM